MKIYTKKGSKYEIPYLLAFSGGAWCFEFIGDLTYTDPFDGSIWNWVGYDNEITSVIAVFDAGQPLLQTDSYADCLALPRSFYWDDVNGILFVSWFDRSGDWCISRDLSRYSRLLAGFANGYSRINKNVFDAVFYDPIINDIGDLGKQADPTKFGLVAYEKSSYTLSDQANVLYQQDGYDCIGDPIIFFLAQDYDTVLTEAMKVFSGYIQGYKHNRDENQYTIAETRIFQNNPVCKNIITVDEFPTCGNEEGKLKPVAWGDIRRGIMILTNVGDLTEANPGTAIFLVADPEYAAVVGIDNVYDKAGEVQAITGTDLASCIVEVTKPADVSPGDLKDWTWEGQGYDIDGDYNNGLDIIVHAFEVIAGIPFLDSLFEVIKWENETLNNPEPIGLSIQSDKGMVEEIIEPISVSLQGVVEILGDGRISWASRNIDPIPIVDIRHIYKYDEMDLPEIGLSSDETVSELVVNYSPNFKDNDDVLSILNNDYADLVAAYYNTRTRDPLSPVETVLFDVDDAEALSEEIMATSQAPTRLIQTDTVELEQSRLFEIIGIDTGLFGNENIEYGELLGIKTNYNDYNQNLTVRIIPDYRPLLYVRGFGYSSMPVASISFGYSGENINHISYGYGVTHFS